jgi:hypothetical protein
LTTNDRVYGDHLVLHGDAVKDVAFTVDDVRELFKVDLFVVVLISLLCRKL